MSPVIAVNETQSELSNLDPKLTVFLVFQVIGLVGAVVTVIAACFSPVKRQATWYNFMFSWIFFCVSYLLLLLAGQAGNSQPPFALCLVQSSLTYAAPPYAASATLGLVVQLFFSVHTTLSGGTVVGQTFWNAAILIVPYIVQFGVFMESLTLGLVHSSESTFSTVSYCSLENNIPGRITAALVIMFLIPVLVLNVIIYLRFRRCRSAVKKASMPKSMLIRVTAFTTFGLVSIIAGLMFFFIVFVKNSVIGLAQLDIVLSIVPVAAVLIFGTHKDLLKAWIFWKWKNKAKVGLKVSPPVTAREIRVMRSTTIDLDIH